MIYWCFIAWFVMMTPRGVVEERYEWGPYDTRNECLENWREFDNAVLGGLFKGTHIRSVTTRCAKTEDVCIVGVET